VPCPPRQVFDLMPSPGSSLVPWRASRFHKAMTAEEWEPLGDSLMFFRERWVVYFDRYDDLGPTEPPPLGRMGDDDDDARPLSSEGTGALDLWRGWFLFYGGQVGRIGYLINKAFSICQGVSCLCTTRSCIGRPRTLIFGLV
jgi:hypothetical protein